MDVPPSEKDYSNIGDGEPLFYGKGPLKYKTGPQSLDIVSRECWGAGPENGEIAILNVPVSNVYFMNVKLDPCYCFKSCQEAVLRTQQYNMTSQFQTDIRFNFLIGGDGTIFEGRGWFLQPSLPTVHKDQNVDSLLIGYIGRFFRGRNLPYMMTAAAQRLINHGIQNNIVSNMFFYHDIMNYVQHAPRPVMGRARASYGNF